MCMDRHELEKALKDFEMQVRKRLPSMINITLANRGSREHEFNFRQFVETLERKRRMLMKESSKIGRHEQKTRFLNASYSMDSQLKGMEGKEAFRRRVRLRHRKIEAPVEYDAGSGPKKAKVLNVMDDSMLIETTEKVPLNREINISVSGKDTKGRVVRSLTMGKDTCELEVKLTDIQNQEDIAKKLTEIMEKLKDTGNN